MGEEYIDISQEIRTYPTRSLSYPPSRLIGTGAGWLNGGRAKRDAIKVECAAYLRLQTLRGKCIINGNNGKEIHQRKYPFFIRYVM